MVRSIQILPVLLLLAFASVVTAQTPLTPCVNVDIDGPSEVEPNMPAMFKARITGSIPATKPDFKWTVSAGEITKGQGTEEITVDTAGLGGQEINATVELSGTPPGCKGSASRTTQVKVPGPACGLRFDQYGDIHFEDEKARLDNFAIQLQNDLDSFGQILMTAGQRTFKNETAERLARAKSWLVNVRKIDPNRIITLDCGFNRDFTITLEIIPVGLTPLTCDSFSEVPFSEVKFTKPRPKSSKRRR
jgi:hypothetical protein